VRDALRALAAAGLALFVVFAALEILLRILDPAVGARVESISPFGGRYMPHTRIANDRENAVRDRINNLGFHDREFDFDLAAGVRRVGFFGDSFTEALQVEADSTFVNRFEDLSRAEGVALDAAAFGMSGSGADQSFFRCLAALHSARFDDVVYVFFQNDFIDGYNRAAKPASWPFVERDSLGAWYFAGQYQPDRRRRGLADGIRSYLKGLYLPSFVSYRLFLLRAGRGGGANAPGRAAPIPIDRDDRFLGRLALGDSISTEYRAAREHWEDVMRLWRDAANARGASLSILYMPGQSETDDSTYAAVIGGRVPRFGLASWMRAFCERESIGFLDPTEAFIAATGGRGRQLYWEHLNYTGHRILAEYLRDSGRFSESGETIHDTTAER
jgi:hypothetical protein